MGMKSVFVVIFFIAQMALGFGSLKLAPVQVGDMSLEIQDRYGPIIRYKGQIASEGSYLQFHSPDYKDSYLDTGNRAHNVSLRVTDIGKGAKCVTIDGNSLKNGVRYIVRYKLYPDNHIEISNSFHYEKNRPTCSLEYGVMLLPSGPFAGRLCEYGNERLTLPLSPLPGNERFMRTGINDLTFYSRIGKITIKTNSPAGMQLIDWRDYAFAVKRAFDMAITCPIPAGSTTNIVTTVKFGQVPDAAATQNAQKKARLPKPYDFAIIPTPQVCQKTAGTFSFNRDLVIKTRANSSSKELAFIKTFVNDADKLAGKKIKIENGAIGNANLPTIYFGTAGGEQKIPEPETGKWVNSAEGYSLAMSPDSIIVRGADVQGLWYGLQTVYQMLANANDSDPSAKIAPCVNIQNWPDIKFRAMHIPFQPRADLEFTRQLIKLLAMYHYNAVFFEVFDSIQYDKNPIASSDEAFSKKQIRELVDLADQYGLEMIPGLNSLGHAQGWLFQPDRLKRFSGEVKGLVEDASQPDVRRERTLCPSNPDVYVLLFGVYDELIELFHPKRFFVSLDEAYDWCECPRCKGKDPAKLFAAHVDKLHKYFTSRGIEMVMAQDMLFQRKDWPLGTPSNSRPDQNTAPAIDRIPRKNLLMGCWSYMGKDEFPEAKYLKEKGFDVVGFTWHQKRNIWGFARYAQKYGLYGMSATTWGGPFAVPGYWSLRTTPEHLAVYPRSGDAFWSCQKPASAPAVEPYNAEAEADRYCARHINSPDVTYTPLNVDSSRNWALNDKVAADNAREAFDYGPDKDLSGLTRLTTGMDGIAYDGLQTGKAIAIGGAWEPNIKAPQKVTVDVAKKADAILVLHTCGWPTKNETPVAKYVINYEDGTSQPFEIQYGRDILAFDSNLFIYNPDSNRIWPAYVAKTRGGDTIRVQTLRLENPKPGVAIKSIDFESLKTSASPMVLAVTLENKSKKQ